MFKKHISSLRRYQTSENRDLIKGIILDRNERADHYNQTEFNLEVLETPLILGDLNYDSIINITDILLLVNIIMYGNLLDIYS